VITSAVAACVTALPDDQLPAYVHDLTALREHAAEIRAALPPEVECYYAAKANPAEPVLRALAPMLDGVEVASGGELAHVTAALPSARIAFGGPAKSDAELASALRAGVHRLHVESVHELRRIGLLAAALRMTANVLLRVNLPLATGEVALAMGGLPSPFGLDPADVPECLEIIEGNRWLDWHGVHAHLASGLAAADQVTLAGAIVDWALPLGAREVNIGGGMAVVYDDPSARYDWVAFGKGLRGILDRAGDVRLRIEPGRALTAYCGWYAAPVVDVKRSHGAVFALVRGGTHHLRTPVTKGHDQPFDVLPVPDWHLPWTRPGVSGLVTIAGQLCTPKDVLARNVPVRRLMTGDRVVFGMAGAYAWNISHLDFLMHPRPTFHYV
jgi:diaminopimelate decarboxylase